MCQYNIIKTFVFGPSYFSSGARILKKFIRLVKLISMKCSQNIAKKSLNDADSQFDDCQSHLYQNLKIVKGVKRCQDRSWIFDNIRLKRSQKTIA